MSSSFLGLPPVPADLKSIAPYLQRADEIKNQDPVVSYWCAYYAAQAGIALKARSAPARDLLFALLTSLENMKSAIGSNDAIDVESVSSAYMENFALKVFANADNEDRAGRATRATAKKFLAAANFLEVLKTFPKSEVSEANEDKIRYAKWKAADIGKAFREGRKPVPGPPGWAEEQEQLKALALQQGEEQPTLHIPSPPQSHPNLSSSQSHSPPRTPPTRSPHISSSPPKPDLHFDLARPNPGWPADVDGPPESWSTSATPGTEPSDIYTIGTPTPSTGQSTAPEAFASHQRSGSGSSLSTLGINGAQTTHAWMNDELAGKLTPSSSPQKSSFKSGSPDSDKKVHFSPSTAGSPPPPPPPHLTASGSPPQQYHGPSSIYGPPEPSTSPPRDPHYNHPYIPNYTSVQSPRPPGSPSTSPPRSYNIYAPVSAPQVAPTRFSHPSAPPPPPPPPPQAFELTPGIIGKAQKHCRFAISALDYEDAEQARKELRAALALLGG